MENPEENNRKYQSIDINKRRLQFRIEMLIFEYGEKKVTKWLNEIIKDSGLNIEWKNIMKDEKPNENI